MGVNFCEDRFGNANHVIYVFRNEFSFVNLGTYDALKPKVGSISLWFKTEREVATGKGYPVNPILLTKSRIEDDFFEAYGIYRSTLNGKVNASSARDSIRQTVFTSKEVVSLFEWHHVVISYNDDFFSLYLDGTLQYKAIKKFETNFRRRFSINWL